MYFRTIKRDFTKYPILKAHVLFAMHLFKLHVQKSLLGIIIKDNSCIFFSAIRCLKAPFACLDWYQDVKKGLLIFNRFYLMPKGITLSFRSVSKFTSQPKMIKLVKFEPAFVVKELKKHANKSNPSLISFSGKNILESLLFVTSESETSTSEEKTRLERLKS